MGSSLTSCAEEVLLRRNHAVGLAAAPYSLARWLACVLNPRIHRLYDPVWMMISRSIALIGRSRMPPPLYHTTMLQRAAMFSQLGSRKPSL